MALEVGQTGESGEQSTSATQPAVVPAEFNKGEEAGTGSGGEVKQDQAAPEGTGDTAGDSTEGGIELLSQSEIETLRGDPDKLVKALNRAATSKFQQIADVRKSADKYNDYKDFIEALEEDPEAATRALATRLGIATADSAPKQEGDKEDLEDKVVSMVTDALGPEYEDLSPRLAQAIRSVAQEVVKEASAPIIKEQENLVRSSADREAAAALKAFEASHPDWKKHEKTMVSLSKKFPPGEGVSDEEYLEHIYYLATRDTRDGDAVVKAVDKIADSASRASEGKGSSVPEKNISQRPAKPPSFQEAYQAARQGIQFD